MLISSHLKYVCWFSTFRAFQWNLKLVHIHRQQERPKKEADHSRLVGGSFNKKGNLCTRLVLSGHKMSRSLHQPVRILEVNRQALTRVSQSQFRWSQQHLTLSGLHPWNSSDYGNSGQNTHSKDRGGGRRLPLSRSSSWVNWQSCPLDVLISVSCTLKHFDIL